MGHGTPAVFSGRSRKCTGHLRHCRQSGFLPPRPSGPVARGLHVPDSPSSGTGWPSPCAGCACHPDRWIGSSFYFVALDLGLRKVPDLPPGAYGEEWQVHGGGFYHIQKYLVAPSADARPPDWFKWESYATWLSGFAMLCIVYYAGANLFWSTARCSMSRSGRDSDLDGLCSASAGWSMTGCKSEARRDADGADAPAVLRPRGDGTALCPPLHRSCRAPASGRLHRHDHDGERLLRDHAATSGSSSRTSKAGRTPDRNTARSPSCARRTTTTLTLPVLS